MEAAHGSPYRNSILPLEAWHHPLIDLGEPAVFDRNFPSNNSSGPLPTLERILDQLGRNRFRRK